MSIRHRLHHHPRHLKEPSNVQQKHFLTSKTLWINVLGGLVTTIATYQGLVPAKYVPVITAVGSIANILLRLVTNTGLTMSTPPATLDMSKR